MLVDFAVLAFAAVVAWSGVVSMEPGCWLRILIALPIALGLTAIPLLLLAAKLGLLA